VPLQPQCLSPGCVTAGCERGKPMRWCTIWWQLYCGSSDTLVWLASLLSEQCVKKQCSLAGLCFGGCMALNLHISRVSTGVAAMGQDCTNCISWNWGKSTKNIYFLDTLAKRCQQKLKSHLKKRFESIIEGISKLGNTTLLNKIYTELYITEGGSREVNNEHEVQWLAKVFTPHFSYFVALQPGI
jgi:hypothetical protein